MTRIIFGKTTALVLTVALVFGVAMTAEAQRGRPMMERPQAEDYDDRYMERGPGMMDRQGMGMAGPGMGMMGGRGMPCPIMNQMGHGMGMAAPLDLPDLTVEQQQEISTIQREMRRSNMETMMDIMDIRDDMMDEMAAERPDPEKIREMQSAMSEKQGEMLETSIQNRNRIYDLLTEEQQEQLREYRMRPGGSPWDQHRTR